METKKEGFPAAFWVCACTEIFDQNSRKDYLRLDLNENPGGLPQKFIDDVLKNVTPQFVFDIDTVFKGKVLLVSWNIFTHGYPSFYCCQKER